MKKEDLKSINIMGKTIIYSDIDSPGAPIKKGEHIIKIKSEEGDSHPIGTRGVIVGSLGPLNWENRTDVYGYFVKWETDPLIPVFVTDFKIKKEE